MMDAVQIQTSNRARLRDKRRNRGRIAARMRQEAAQGEFPDLGFGGYFKAADAVCDSAIEASDGDLDKFMADAHGDGQGEGFDLFEQKVGEKLAAHGGPFIDLITKLLPLLLPLLTGCLPIPKP